MGTRTNSSTAAASAAGKPRSTMADRQRAQRAELVREEVIDAALAEFAERGYHQTSISHIAARLGSGHSMFYRYFENKRDIFVALLDKISEDIGEVVRSEPAEARSCRNDIWMRRHAPDPRPIQRTRRGRGPCARRRASTRPRAPVPSTPME